MYTAEAREKKMKFAAYCSISTLHRTTAISGLLVIKDFILQFSVTEEKCLCKYSAIFILPPFGKLLRFRKRDLVLIGNGVILAVNK